jgi:pantothenate kinase
MQELSRLVESLLADSPPPERRLLGIVGPPGSGKSTLAEILVSEINQHLGAAVAIEAPMDGFHLQDEELARLGILPLKGIPASFDVNGFLSTLEELVQVPPQAVAWPAFDRASERSIPGASTIEPSHRLIIVSGNYLLLTDRPWDKVAGLLHWTWFVDAPLDVLYARLVARHMAGGKDEAAARAKVESTDMPNARLVLANKARATRIVTFELPQP